MPEAVATTKRRYQKALDAITSSSQVSLAPSTSASATSAKPPATATAAFDEARERVRKRLRHSTSSSSLVPTFVASSTPTKTSGTVSKEPPNFAPWSHEAFLARLKTFSSVSQWHPKPESISEVEWAKRGWICVDVNTVACRGGCERRVVVSLDSQKKKKTSGLEDDDDDDNVEDEAAFESALAERYKDSIINGHASNCLWRKAGCKDDIYRLQVVRPSIWQPELRRRFLSAIEISNAITTIAMKTIDRTDAHISSPERLLKELPADITSTPATEMDTPARTRALEVAFHGWRGSTEAGSELLHCDACFQRIGLWMYQPGYKPKSASAEDGEDAAVIDLVEMHREHCPWRNPTTQRGSGSLAGLNASQILQRVVSTYARDYRRRTNEPGDVEDAQTGGDVVDGDVEMPVLSRDEIAKQDKERESRLRKLKSLFSIKRKSAKVAPKAAAR